MTRLLIALLVLALNACAAASETPPARVTAIANVTLLDGRGGPARPGVTVLVSEGRIGDILEAGRAAPRSAGRIDGGGGFLLPGFIDMHAHLLVPRCGGSFDRAVSERMLGALLDFGITTIRSPGNPTVSGLRLRDELNGGEVRGPRALASAEIVNDPRMTDAELRAYVRDAIPYRPDYFKFHARMPPASVAPFVAEAHAHGVPVIGHLQSTSTVEAIALDVDHITHAVDWSPAMLRPDRRAGYAAAREARGAIRARLDWLELLDLDSPEVAAAVAALVESGASMDPTLVAYDTKFRTPASPRYRRNPSVDRVPEMHADWRRCQGIAEDWTAADHERWAAAWPKLLGYVRMLHDARVLLTTGSDVTNPWVIPGESLHQEFELLAEAGIPPAEILKMTGENASRALSRSDVGVVEPGRLADLVLLGANPLDAIANTRSIRWVMQAGEIVAEPGRRPGAP